MADASDTEITAAVRKVLVKHWVDVSRIRIRVTRGVLILTGTIDKIYGAEGGPVDRSFLSSLDQGLQAVKGLRRIRYQFGNWAKDGGEWVVPAG
jgi:hypothetical protein